MNIQRFKRVGGQRISLDLDRVVGVEDHTPGHTLLWVYGRDEPVEVEGDPEDVRRSIERER